jgi:hypothetical protein
MENQQETSVLHLFGLNKTPRLETALHGGNHAVEIPLVGTNLTFLRTEVSAK